MTDLTQLSILEASDALRRGDLSAGDLVEATMRRIEETEPRIHAYTHLYGERAVVEARERDREMAAGRWRGPLHGIPVAVKDLLYTKDAPTEAGSAAMQGWVPGFDATVVERLRDAGAIIVGKTVTHELAYGVNVPPPAARGTTITTPVAPVPAPARPWPQVRRSALSGPIPAAPSASRLPSMAWSD